MLLSIIEMVSNARAAEISSVIHMLINEDTIAKAGVTKEIETTTMVTAKVIMVMATGTITTIISNNKHLL